MNVSIFVIVIGSFFILRSEFHNASPGEGGHLGIFWVGMCRPGLQIGTPFEIRIPLKLIPRSRNGPSFLYPVLESALKLTLRSRNGPFFYTPF